MRRTLAFTLWLAGAALAAGPGCKREAPTPLKKPEAPMSVKLVKAKKGEIQRNVSLPALVAANQQATLYSKVTGYLKTIPVDKGDEVKQGDLIAEIEAPELLADSARYKAEAEIAALDYQRAGEAQKKAPDLIPVQTIDTAKAKMETAKANLQRAETLLGFTRLSAPFAGTITRRFADPGAFVPAATAGNAAESAALVTLADFKVVRIRVAVPEPEVPLIKKGLPVKVSVEELPATLFEGVITRSSQALDEASKTMLVEIDLQNPAQLLKPGMFATAKIGVEKHADALLVPIEAVMFEKSGTSVFLLAQNQAKKTPVKTGFNDGPFMEVLSGIGEGDAVIVVGKMTLSNGQSVVVMETK